MREQAKRDGHSNRDDDSKQRDVSEDNFDEEYKTQYYYDQYEEDKNLGDNARSVSWHDRSQFDQASFRGGYPQEQNTQGTPRGGRDYSYSYASGHPDYATYDRGRGAKRGRHPPQNISK